MDAYHLRRQEKAIEDEENLWAILGRQKYMTLALCHDNQPYLATVNYAFDRAARCLYFHCASAGRKMDYLAANPLVWGQVLEDGGYLDGACDHAFRTVQFAGRVTFLAESSAKVHALGLLVDRLESQPAAVRARLITPVRVSGVTIARVDIETMTGKQSGV